MFSWSLLQIEDIIMSPLIVVFKCSHSFGEIRRDFSFVSTVVHLATHCFMHGQGQDGRKDDQVEIMKRICPLRSRIIVNIIMTFHNKGV